MDWTVKVTDLAIIFATIAGPILAVQAQKWLEAHREIARRQRELFYTLMRTRASALAIEHVNALNAIQLEFYGEGAGVSSIRTALKVYLNHLYKDTSQPGWGERRIELLYDLLKKIGAQLRYEFDAVELEKEVYAPVAYARAEFEQKTIREGVAAMFLEGKPLPLAVTSLPANEDAVARFKRLQEKLEVWLDAQIKPVEKTG